MRRASFLFVAALVSVAAPAAAQGSPAEKLFTEGRAAMDRGDYEAACPKLAESLRLSGEGGPRLSLAECEERRGHLARALEILAEAVRVLPKSSVQGKTAAERAAALERRVPVITIEVAEAPAEIGLELDGHAITNRTQRADPGEHVIVATASGCAAGRFPFPLTEGERRTVPVKPGGCGGGETRAAPSSSSSPASPSRQRTVGFVVGGVGLAGVVVFGVTGALALSKQSTVDDHCRDHRCDPTGLAAGRAGTSFDVANAIALGVGVAGLGAGAVLIATAPKSPRSEVSLSVRPSTTGVSFALSTPLAF